MNIVAKYRSADRSRPSSSFGLLFHSVVPRPLISGTCAAAVWFMAIIAPVRNMVGGQIRFMADCRVWKKPRQLVEPILQPRIADSSSRKAANNSSARTTKRFPSPRCASTIQIIRPLESIAETQPQLQPALLRLSGMVSQYFGRDHRVGSKTKRRPERLFTFRRLGWARFRRRCPA
jgi:hypothetical protein